MAVFFQFESDFVESLRCIPMQVRYKLDSCGVKLKLAHWNHFTPDDRALLVQLPCQTSAEAQAYRDRLHQIVAERTDLPVSDLPIDPNPEWLQASIPTSVQQKAQEFAVEITPAQWQALTPLQRFALIKLSRSGHENRNFLPALTEFHLLASSD